VPGFPPARGPSVRSPCGDRSGSFRLLRPSPPVRSPGGRASGPSARLASLHRSVTSQVATPAMALLRFPLRPACARTRAQAVARSRSRGRPPRRSEPAPLSLRPAVASARQRAGDPFRASLPDPDRRRFPGPCLPGVHVGPAFPRRVDCSFKASLPGRSAAWSWSDHPPALLGFCPLGCSPPPPWLPLVIPGPSSCALPASRPVGRVTRRSGVLRCGGVGVAVSGRQPFWASWPCAGLFMVMRHHVL
jgi:hypothetical protein